MHITRLIVDGAPHVRGDLVALGVREELRALLAAGPPVADSDLELVIDADGQPYQAGEAVAAVLYKRVVAVADDV